MGRDVAATVPAAAAHEAPVADALGGVVGVVEVGEAEQQMPQLVGGDADLRVLRDGEVAVDLRAVGVVGRRQGRLVRPDVAQAAGDLGAGAGVDDDERVDVAVAVVVVRREVDIGVGGDGRVVRELRRAEGRAALADPGPVVGVPRQRLRHPIGADDRAVEGDEPVRHLGVVLLDAAVRQDAGREEQVLEVARRRGHRLVREVDEDDGDADGSPQRGPLECGRPDGGLRRPGGEGLGRDDDAVVEAQPLGLTLEAQGGGTVRLAATAGRGELLGPALLQLRARGDGAGRVPLVPGPRGRVDLGHGDLLPAHPPARDWCR